MRVEFLPAGIYLPEIDLWLDARESAEACWLSHAHADHAGALHRTALGTGTTLELYGHRQAEGSVPARVIPLEFRVPYAYNGATLTALPASHIIGAAQLLVEYGGERLVYTGDIKLRDPLCGTPTEIVACDRLIIESTFGLPIYRFLDRDQAREQMVAFARECLAAGETPVFLGYALGRGQEIGHVLATAGIPTMLQGAIARYVPAYEGQGYAFPGWAPYDRNAVEGHAVVALPGFAVEGRVAYVSGWAMLDNARTRASAEELIPYSDHADFQELLALVERSGAREVDVVHGYTEPFARILNQRGIAARARRRDD